MATPAPAGGGDEDDEGPAGVVGAAAVAVDVVLGVKPAHRHLQSQFGHAIGITRGPRSASDKPGHAVEHAARQRDGVEIFLVFFFSLGGTHTWLRNAGEIAEMGWGFFSSFFVGWHTHLAAECNMRGR